MSTQTLVPLKDSRPLVMAKLDAARGLPQAVPQDEGEDGDEYGDEYEPEGDTE